MSDALVIGRVTNMASGSLGQPITVEEATNELVDAMDVFSRQLLDDDLHEDDWSEAVDRAFEELDKTAVE